MKYTLHRSLQEAQQQGVALGHFNFATMAMARGIFDAARTLSATIPNTFTDNKIPVVLGISEGDRELFGTKEALAIVRLWQTEYDYPIFLDADHVHDATDAQEVLSLGYDMVVFDAVEKPLAENIALTSSVVAHRNAHNLAGLVEAEIGFISSGSDIKAAMPSGVGPETMTQPDDATAFIAATGIDAIAPSVGNIHGLVVGGNPRLDISRVAALHAALGTTPIVLHGGSGTSDQDFRDAIAAGITMVHISTDIRKSYKEALVAAFAQNPESVSPAKYVPASQQAVYDTAARYIQLFMMTK